MVTADELVAPHRQAVDREFTGRAVLLVHRLEPGDLAGVDERRRPAIQADKRLHVARVRLADIPCVVELIVQRYEHSSPARTGVRCCGDRIVEVARTISANCGCRTHRPNHHDGLVTMGYEAEKIARLLERIGSVSDDGAVALGRVQSGVQTVRQFQPHLIIHVLATDVDHLLS